MSYTPDNDWIQCPAATIAMKDITNSLNYTLPGVAWGDTLSTGNRVIKLLDGSYASTNVVNGVAIAQFRMALGMIPGVTDAAWFSNAFLLNQANTITNYSQLSIYRYPADAAPLNFGSCKFDTFRLRANFDRDGAVQMVRMDVVGYSADPLDGTAISLPSAGPLGALMAFANSAFTGATQVSGIEIFISRNDVPIPQTNTSGSNAALPVLTGGVLQGTLSGSCTLTQSGIATTVPAAGATLTVAFGSTGYGESIAVHLGTMTSQTRNVDMGIHYQTSSFDLDSVDGTNGSVIAWTDL
jgi:hypothetical protein